MVIATACSPDWEISIISQEQAPITFSHKDIRFYIEKSSEDIKAIPLGQVLYAHNFSLIDSIAFTIEGGSKKIYNWAEIASEATISSNGMIKIAGTEIYPGSIHVHSKRAFPVPQYSIMDIAPTMAKALGLPKLPDGMGVNRFEGTAKHAVMILLDGLQYEKLMQLIEAGNLPFFAKHKNCISLGLTVYPPITTSATAALLTSTPPQVNGVYGYGYRSTESTTLFDITTNAGYTAIAVEGASLAFNLRNAETILSGDRDGDGFSDDNVLLNSLDVIQTGMPELLYIHFHDIDDMGHNYGPDSREYEEALIRADSYLLEIFEALPENSLIAIFADHGMHATEEGGNHGTLTAQDMKIPILFILK